MPPRVLKPEEYPKLLELVPKSWPDWLPRPDASLIVVEEENGEIIGFAVAQTAVHLEPWWIREDKRNGLVGMRLYEAVEAELLSRGIDKWFTFSPSKFIGDYLRRLGLKLLPWRIFVRGE